jgi:hypothetical protein
LTIRSCAAQLPAASTAVEDLAEGGVERHLSSIFLRDAKLDA